MSLNEQIEQDLISAMKARDAEKLSALRMLKAALTNVKILKKKEALDDDEVMEVVQKQAKQRRESIDSFEKAGRTELADKEKRELAILEAYLPKQLSDDEIRALASEAIKTSGASSKADTGKVMKVLMPVVKGKADGQRVNQILAGMLS